MTPVEKQRLFLVEDDRELASMVSDFLTGNGFEVTIEHDGKSALDRIKLESFDVIVLDIGLRSPMSKTITSNDSNLIRSSADLPSCSIVTSNPLPVRKSETMDASSRSSSTKNRRCFSTGVIVRAI